MYDMIIKIFVRDVCYIYNDFLLEFFYIKFVNELYLLMWKIWVIFWLGFRYMFVIFIIIVVFGCDFYFNSCFWFELYLSCLWVIFDLFLSNVFLF